MKPIAVAALLLAVFTACSGGVPTASGISALPTTRAAGFRRMHPNCSEPEIFVGGNKFITGYACGTVVSALGGAKTGIAPGPMVVEQNPAQIFAVNHSGGINIFSAYANGNVFARDKLQSPAFYSPGFTLAVDASGYLWVGQQFNGYSGSLYRFAPGADGQAMPIQDIAGMYTGLLSGPSGIALDEEGDPYVTDEDWSSAYSVREFSAASNGNVSPIRIIEGTKTGLNYDSQGIAIDSNGRIVVSNYARNSIFVFVANANGNVAPVQTITGSNTDLDSPQSLAVGPSNNIYVANAGANEVLKFTPNADGNQSPVSALQNSDGAYWVQLCAECLSQPGARNSLPGGASVRRHL